MMRLVDQWPRLMINQQALGLEKDSTCMVTSTYSLSKRLQVMKINPSSDLMVEAAKHPRQES